MANFLTCCFLSVVFAILQRSMGETEVVVKIPELGKLRGKFETVPTDKNRVRAFLGVKYGIAPLGQQRFRPPLPVKKWNEVENATELAQSCYGTTDNKDFKGSSMWNAPTKFNEDCLNLNIWTPKDANEKSKLPVMVWIFGGGFFSGSPSLDLYNGGILASENTVVVVNINYRLGPFGFLYFGQDSSAPGNVGLLDQQMALKWVKDHIEHFGGDPSRITIFGESAGAASVSAHLVAPESRDLFHNAIMQSGSISNPWAVVSPEDMLARSLEFAGSVQCGNGTVEDMTECLRSDGKTAELMQKLENVWPTTNLNFLGFPFAPINVDVNFFKGEDVFKSLQSGNFKKCPVIIGTNTDEGTYWLPYNLPAFSESAPDALANSTKPHSQNLLTAQQYKDSIERCFGIGTVPPWYDSPVLVKGIGDVYAPQDKSSPGTGFRDAVGDFVDDFFFTCDVLDLAQVLAENGNQVYLYYFDQRSSANPWPEWMGVMHGYEIEYIFGYPLAKPVDYGYKIDSGEDGFTKTMMQIWTSFAQDGSLKKTSGVEWEPFDVENRNGTVKGLHTN